MQRTKRTCAAAAVALVALAGCGGSGGSGGSTTQTASLPSFKAGLSAVDTKYADLPGDIDTAVTGAGSKSNSQLATEFSGLATRTKAMATDVGKLKPPAKYKADAQRMTAALNAVAKDLSGISTAATNGDVTAAENATKALLTDSGKVKVASDTLDQAVGLSSASASATSTTS
jgi:hypothetical protein